MSQEGGAEGCGKRGGLCACSGVIKSQGDVHRSTEVCLALHTRSGGVAWNQRMCERSAAGPRVGGAAIVCAEILLGRSHGCSRTSQNLRPAEHMSLLFQEAKYRLNAPHCNMLWCLGRNRAGTGTP